MLTDAQIRKTRPQDKPHKLYDADGLYLLIRPSGGKSWLFRYPAVSLREARRIVADAQLKNFPPPSPSLVAAVQQFMPQA